MDSRKECVSVPGMMAWQKLVRMLTAGLLVLLLTLSPIPTQISLAARKGRAIAPSAQATSQAASKLAETAPPEILQDLRQELEKYQPQVKIVSPRSQEVLKDTTVTVQFQVKDLPIFKDKTLGLGPHLHVLLDNRSYQAVYDLSQPLVFDNLEPGTHTLRAFASRPWHESFKNEGAYAQTTFHIFTKTQEHSPDPSLPLLTYSRPQGSYGAEPILLDFYLTNAPLHLVAREDKKDDIADWRIRCTVNGKSFMLDQWQPIYLKGFKPGKNWVQLEFLDEIGNPVPNVFNNTARIITYEPGGQDTLAKLVRGDFSLDQVRSLVDPDYQPPVPKSLPTPSPEPTKSPVEPPATKPIPAPVPLPVPIAPVVKATPKPAPSPTPGVSPSPPLTQPTVKPTVQVPQGEESPPPVKTTPKPVLPPSPPVPPASPQAQEPTPQKSPEVPPLKPVKPAPAPEAVKQSPQETINQFLQRFRPPARSSKAPAPGPMPTPSINPSPQPVQSPTPIAPPKPVITPKRVESPKPTPKSFEPDPISTPEVPMELKTPPVLTAPAPPERIAPANPG